MSYDDWKTTPPAAEKEPPAETVAYSESDMRAVVLAERAAILRTVRVERDALKAKLATAVELLRKVYACTIAGPAEPIAAFLDEVAK